MNHTPGTPEAQEAGKWGLLGCQIFTYLTIQVAVVSSPFDQPWWKGIFLVQVLLTFYFANLVFAGIWIRNIVKRHRAGMWVALFAFFLALAIGLSLNLPYQDFSPLLEAGINSALFVSLLIIPIGMERLLRPVNESVPSSIENEAD